MQPAVATAERRVQPARHVPCWRTTVLIWAVALGAAVTAITEGLSLVASLTRLWVAASWAALSFAAIVYVALGHRWPRRIGHLQPGAALPTLFLLGPTGLLVALTGVVAAAAPPNTFDSMTYHMSRVVHWQQQASVANYPTHILRELHSAPWAEFAILQLQLLTGGDRLANFVQWTCMLGALVGASLIAKHYGGDAVVQLFASLFVASLPMGLMQATSTQTDYAAACWLVCYVVFTLQALDRGAGEPRWATVIGLGASLGLGVLTKATVYLFALPFLVWIGVTWLRQRGRGAWPAMLVVGVIALSLNVGQLARNVDTYGTPLGPGHEDPAGAVYVNGLFTPAAFASNVVRNLSLQIATPSTAANSAIDSIVKDIHRVLGLDASDPRTTWQQVPGQAFFVPRLDFDEDSAGNPLQFALIVLSLLLCLGTASLRRRMSGTALPYAAALTSGFLLFALVLRWQPWNNRLLLPLFVLWAPFVAVVLGARAPRPLMYGMGIGLMLLALPWGFRNYSRPLLGEHSVLRVSRTDQYFRVWPSLEPGYVAAARTLAASGCTRVGLVAGWNDWEYPLWVLLQPQAPGGVQIQHVGVDNASARLARGPFEPCAIVDITVQKDDPERAARIAAQIGSYAPVAMPPGPVTVLLRSG